MGDIDASPVLLIMGLGAQLLLWRTEFCEKLASHGLRIIRYDNRDVGLSDKTERRSVGQPLVTRLLRSWVRLPSKATYTPEDMAADAARTAVVDQGPGAGRTARCDPRQRGPRGQVIGSPRYRIPDEQIRAEAAEGYDRNYYPAGRRRAVQRNPGQRKSGAPQSAHRGAHGCHSRAGRQTYAAHGRTGDSAGNKRRPIGVIRQNGT